MATLPHATAPVNGRRRRSPTAPADPPPKPAPVVLARLTEAGYARLRRAGTLTEGYHFLHDHRRADLCRGLGADPTAEDTVVGMVLAVRGLLHAAGVRPGDISIGHHDGRRRQVLFARAVARHARVSPSLTPR